MPYIPHTDSDVQAMLAAIGANAIDDLFDEIPANLRRDCSEKLPERLTEMEAARLMRERAVRDAGLLCFAGAGAYEHHIPAAVWEIATRGEFYTAYTPYQAEASQGTLQLLYEFQTMMANLTGMEAANASLYDGASALAEAVLMAVRLNRKSKSKRVLMPTAVHPAYRKAAHTIVKNQQIFLDEVSFESGQTAVAALEAACASDKNIAAAVIPQPNFFGCLEAADELTDWAHAQNALVIAVVNPLAMALFSPPGEWGQQGADIVCGEGQPLGIPLSSGGPYLGFMCCKKKHVRQMPGRIVGRTRDLADNPGYTLTLQAREQHIRRSKATSNICTNQGLMATAATIHLALLGAEGLERTALACHANTKALVAKLTAIEGVEPIFTAPCFHEAALRLNAPTADVLEDLAACNILGGYDLAADYPELGNALSVCATEMRTAEEIDHYADCLRRILSK